jgi:type I restriction enzyme R subunit
VRFNEDTLVQQTTADYLRDELGWESIYAYNDETFGPEGTLGRKDDREIVLTRYLGEALITLNPGLPQEAYQDAIRQITAYSLSQSPLQINQEKHDLLRGGVQVSFRDDKGELVKRRLRVFDFDEPANNHFLAVRELWVRGVLYRRRADVIGFVNGLPLLFMELKNVHKDIRAAYDRNLADYKDTIPHLFHHNAVIVLGNGIAAKLGSLSSRYEHFHEWKRLDEDEPGVVDMETLLKGVCNKRNFLDLFENFIVFDDSSGKLVKIVARNHQFLGVNKALQAVRERKERLGKLGVFWHTQGSGKSYSMVFFTRKIHRKLGFLTERGFRLDDILERTGFGRNRAIIEAKEVVNENDESRKRFEILAREVFKKFKACITLKGVNDHRRQYDAINIIYASLQADRENADITDILRKLHAVVDQAIEPRGAESGPESSVVYDISQIDFERLLK